MNSQSDNKVSNDDELRDRVVSLLSRDDGGFFKGYQIYNPRIDELMQLIKADREQAVREARIDELQGLRPGFNVTKRIEQLNQEPK